MIEAARGEHRPLSVGIVRQRRRCLPRDRRRAASFRTSSPIRPRLTISSMAMCRRGSSLDEVRALRTADPQRLMAEARRSIVRHVTAMLAFQKAGAVVFDNGNLIRTQAKEAGVANAFDIPIFTEAFLRPLFARAIGPFRWIALSNDAHDIRQNRRSFAEAFQ